MKAAIYARISRDDGTQRGLGVARQEADCRALADDRGWDVSAVFADNDRSAYSGRPRPQYLAMLEAVKAGDVDAVVAWHPDRLQRSPRELEDFIDAIEAAGVEVATVRAGVVDLSSAAGRMTARVVGAVARHESEQKSERQRRKALELAEAGKVGGGGSRPFGFDDDRVTVRASEAAVLRQAVRAALAGRSLRGVIRDVEAAGFLTTTGRPWSTTSMRRLLCSPRIAGLREHRGRIVGDAVWPAIVDPAELHALRRVLLDPARDRRAGSRRYLLSGFARCGLCGASLVARPRGDGAKALVCATGAGFVGCGKIRALADPLDRYVVERLVAKVDADHLRRTATGLEAVDVDPARAEVARIGLQLDELAAQWADGTVDTRSWQSARDALNARLSVAEAATGANARQRTTSSSGGDLATVWPTLSIDQQRAIVDAHIEAITVDSAVRGRNTFDPRRVTITWHE